jgi:hypothetical protein
MPKLMHVLEMCCLKTLSVAIASALDERMNMEHWWIDTDRGKWSIGGLILTGEI